MHLSKNKVQREKKSGLKKEYPLNLSILISGGEETNQDACSNGE